MSVVNFYIFLIFVLISLNWTITTGQLIWTQSLVPLPSPSSSVIFGNTHDTIWKLDRLTLESFTEQSGWIRHSNFPVNVGLVNAQSYISIDNTIYFMTDTNKVKTFNMETNELNTTFATRLIDYEYGCITQYESRYLVIIGGTDKHGMSGGGQTNSTNYYDLSANVWLNGPDLPSPQSNGACTIANNAIYYVSADNQGSVLKLEIGNDLVSNGNSWTSLSRLEYRRFGHVIQHIDNDIYVIGGYSESHTEIIHTLDDSITAHLNDYYNPVDNPGIVMFNNKLWIMGGWSSNLYFYEETNNVFYATLPTPSPTTVAQTQTNIPSQTPTATKLTSNAPANDNGPAADITTTDLYSDYQSNDDALGLYVMLFAIIGAASICFVLIGIVILIKCKQKQYEHEADVDVCLPKVAKETINSTSSTNMVNNKQFVFNDSTAAVMCGVLMDDVIQDMDATPMASDNDIGKEVEGGVIAYVEYAGDNMDGGSNDKNDCDNMKTPMGVTDTDFIITGTDMVTPKANVNQIEIGDDEFVVCEDNTMQ